MLQPKVSTKTKDLTLEQPLGKWKYHSKWFQNKLDDGYSHSTDILCIKDDNRDTYGVHHFHHRSNFQLYNNKHRALLFMPNTHDTTTHTPKDITPMRAQYCGNYSKTF